MIFLHQKNISKELIDVNKKVGYKIAYDFIFSQKKILHSSIDQSLKYGFLKDNRNYEYYFRNRKWRFTKIFFEKFILMHKLANLSCFNWLPLRLYLGKFQILNFIGEFLL